MMNAAARVTTPRMPAHPTRKALGAQPAAPRLEVSSSGTRSAKIQISRIPITVTRTEAHTSAIHPSGRSEASTSAMIQFVCSPISRKTAFSSRNEMAPQVVRSAMRDGAVWIRGALCPSSRPATTTAMTPDACTDSASM